MSIVWKDSHRYSDGRCALLRWIQFPGFQIHFVDQYRKWDGDGSMHVPKMEKFLENLHGDMSEMDAYFDNRIGFQVENIDTFKRSLQLSGESFLQNGNSMFMQLPGGIIVELIAID